MTPPFRPNAPPDYVLHRFAAAGEIQPPIPIDRFATLLVFNGHQGQWEKPAFAELVGKGEA